MKKHPLVEERDQAVEFLSKMYYEGGADYYFNHYSSPESTAKEFPTLPASLIEAAKTFVKASKALEDEVEALKELHDIDPDEVES